MVLVETEADVARLSVRDPLMLAYITQTTLSVDDTAGIVAALQARFPAIAGPAREDICYATTNRQAAVKAVAGRIEALLVIGAPNSSNSQRLVEVGRAAGCGYVQLVQRAADIDWRALTGVRAVGITAGVSAPEVLVDEVVAAFRARHAVTVKPWRRRRNASSSRFPGSSANLHDRAWRYLRSVRAHQASIRAPDVLSPDERSSECRKRSRHRSRPAGRRPGTAWRGAAAGGGSAVRRPRAHVVRGVPRIALWLGLAGLIPFLWSALTQIWEPASALTLRSLGPRFVGPYVGLAYGTVILSFMSGVLWGFTARAERTAGIGYALSVIPALWAFFMVGGGPVSAAINLMAGFAGLLALDFAFQRWGLAPDWWMPFRVMLTLIVLVCLGVTAFG